MPLPHLRDLPIPALFRLLHDAGLAPEHARRLVSAIHRRGARAWEELMSKGVAPEADKSCASPLQQISALARRYQVQATPAIFLGDGRHIGGMRSALDIEKALATVKPVNGER